MPEETNMSGPTSPEEFQKQMQDFLQKQFKTFGTPGFAGAEPADTFTQPEPEPTPAAGEPEPEPERGTGLLEFADNAIAQVESLASWAGVPLQEEEDQKKVHAPAEKLRTSVDTIKAWIKKARTIQTTVSRKMSGRNGCSPRRRQVMSTTLVCGLSWRRQQAHAEIRQPWSARLIRSQKPW